MDSAAHLFRRAVVPFLPEDLKKIGIMSAAMLFAEPLHEWNAHSAGLSWSRKVEFSRNGDAGDFKLLETGEKPWSAIMKFLDVFQSILEEIGCVVDNAKKTRG